MEAPPGPLRTAPKRKSSLGARGIKRGGEKRIQGNPQARDRQPLARPKAQAGHSPGQAPRPPGRRGGRGWAGKRSSTAKGSNKVLKP